MSTASRRDRPPSGGGAALGRGPSWGHATWTELVGAGLGPRGDGVSRPDRPTAARPPPERRGDEPPVVALLPVGAVEAHGPHLPLVTDVVIAVAAAEAALPGLRRLALNPILLPPLPYTAAPFAAAFPGTISVRAATVTALLADVAASLERQGVAALVVVNAHLDPAHLASIRDAVRAHAGPMPVVHPDLTERRWATRLGAEFMSGACHAGRYETSVVMAAASELVREESRRTLPANPASLSEAIRAGKATFEDAGVVDAYCGDPAAATVEEGERTVEVLGRIVVEAVAEAMGEVVREAVAEVAPETVAEALPEAGS